MVRQSALNIVIMGQAVQVTVGLGVYLAITQVYPEKGFESFNLSIFITVGAALIEGLCEPFYAIMLMNSEFKIRAKSESISIFSKSFITYFLVFQNMGLLGYALSQLGYSLILFTMYAWQSHNEVSKKEGFINYFFIPKELKFREFKSDSIPK